MAYGYIRVSSQGQSDGDGPERQKEAIINFCRKCCFGNPEFFFDTITGEADLKYRPQFMAMLDAIERCRKIVTCNPICIVVERADRLARNLLVSEMMRAECFRRKIPLYAADRGIPQDLADTGDDPTPKALIQMMEVMAEWEKAALVKKLAGARARKKLTTGRCEGRLLFGCNSHEASVRKKILALRETGMSLQNISDHLQQNHFRYRGKPWNRGRVYQVLTRRGVKPETIESYHQ